jgi:hypothetical protein
MMLRFGQSNKVTDLVVAGLYTAIKDGWDHAIRLKTAENEPRRKVRFALVYLFGMKGIRSL